MTPHYPNPSVHDVVTGWFSPDIDTSSGLNFGTTIAIMAQDNPVPNITAECN